ncbi:hypothetical protein N7481_011280 [Penicillium waksmanii]|uniref:uncharacterized protein n=1 Tax=Penicillium waksmanii TaxID=69791 RepID=UPI0025481D41|nr:uncharacterized protein N7481_011280 [Penicillium waksmanii]KAJ5974070.1 hypothetical protein N7481_011280 [Penicillium waksmanii]
MSDASLTTIAATTIPERTGTAGGITSFVPLTSAFTANPTCSDLFVNYPNSAHLMGWDPSYGEKADAFYDCNPSIVSQWFAQSEKSGGKAGNCVMAVSSGQILTYASPTASSLYHIFTTTMTSRSTVGAFAITGWNVNYVRSLASSTSTSTSSDNTTSDATSGNSSTSAISGPEELHGQDLPHEMDHAHMVAELPTEHETRYELDGQEDSEEKNK